MLMKTGSFVGGDILVVNLGEPGVKKALIQMRQCGSEHAHWLCLYHVGDLGQVTLPRHLSDSKFLLFMLSQFLLRSSSLS